MLEKLSLSFDHCSRGGLKVDPNDDELFRRPGRSGERRGEGACLDSTNFLARSTRSLDGVRHNQLYSPPRYRRETRQLAELTRRLAHDKWNLWRWRRSSTPTDAPVEVTWLEATRLISHRHRRAGLPPDGGQMQVRLAPQAVVCRPLQGPASSRDARGTGS
jgi:hypothetical protein